VRPTFVADPVPTDLESLVVAREANEAALVASIEMNDCVVESALGVNIVGGRERIINATGPVALLEGC
jgi:hypothetical protein